MSNTSRKTILIHWERFPGGGSTSRGLKEAGRGGMQAKRQVQRPEGERGRREVSMAGKRMPAGGLAHKARDWRKKAGVCMAR